MTIPEEKKLYQEGLSKTRASLWGRIRGVFGGRAAVREEDLEAMEEILVTGDVGIHYATRLIEELRKSLKEDPTEAALKSFLRNWIAHTVAAGEGLSLETPPDAAPRVTLVVGVNGTGKTTTIGKLAHRLRLRGQSSMVVAADTYRAAAVAQLKVWSQRSGSGFMGGEEGGDPAAVVHDALTRAVKTGVDNVLIDTAGRLHTKEPLMRELEKIRKVAGRLVPGAPHQVLLVLDATTGQNALVQAREFLQTAGVTGVILTKMDGSARGGVLIPIKGELGLPVLYVGLGEGIGDLVPFDAGQYAEGLVGE